jgi:two-component system sensor histidine kinase PilS (NtrC family)
VTPRQTLIGPIQSAPRRELYFFGLYRSLEAGILAALLFSPLAGLVGEPRAPELGTAVAIFYLVFALMMLLQGRDDRRLVPMAFIGVCVDILVAGAATYALPEATAGIAMMLLFNVSAAALLLPMRLGVGISVGAALVLGLEYLISNVGGAALNRPLAEMIMFAFTYLAVGYLSAQTGHRARSSEALAEERGVEVANLFEVNELIIRRMRTGVLVVDGGNRVKLANEAATLLLGDGPARDEQGPHLPDLAPELARRLQRWRASGKNDETPMQVTPDQPDVQPRFARLLAGSDLSLVFLDDATVVSRRAESLTLSALGRFSASLAHEIRNPLAAINYAVQLLEESDSVVAGDRRLLQIIHQQCQRTNGIVESVLGLARRERATPEHLELNAFVRRFVDEFRQNMSIETDSLETVIGARDVPALVDSRHLHQIVTVLVQNALNYGRLPGEPARVRIRVFQVDQRPMVDVLDRGPGIPEAVASQLFRPFYTTSEHGTGLGLYIARELARANQATLDYIPVPGGGCCFRIAMPGPHAFGPN